MEHNRVVAVLTGDIVKSTRMDAAELHRVRDAVSAAADRAASFSESSPALAPSEFFRGDSWQAIIPNDFFALRAALFIRSVAIATGADTRVAIGVGQIDDLSAERVSLSTGEAFLRSGRCLDEMKRSQFLALSDVRYSDGAAPWVQASLRLCDELVGRWTPRQAEFLEHVLDNPRHRSHEAIAVECGTTQQVVSRSLSAAGWRAIEQLLVTYERGNVESISFYDDDA